MRFSIQVVDLEEGTVFGTNDTEELDDYISDERYVIIPTGGVYFCGSRIAQEILPLPKDQETEKDDEDD